MSADAGAVPSAAVLRSSTRMLKPGTVLQDRYVIVDMLAEGGMGEVYRAEYTNLRGRYVAVKASKIDSSNEMLRRQFEKEAVLLFDLKHGALPKVFDLFADERGQFLVMEFIDGRDLAKVLEDRGGPIDLATAMHWADQLLDALEYLHERNPPVVHRDIKPQNIKLTVDGRVVLLDFGLAKSTGSLHTMTTKSVHGHTPEYAPIEQVHGEGTDERSDVYSLAATLYTLLAYRPPARAPMRASAALEGRPDPLVPLPQINPAVPVAVWEVIQWGMSLMREKRPNTARAMRKALHDSLRGTGILTQPAKSPSAGDQGATWVENTAELWLGNTNPQAGGGATDGPRGHARPTVAQESGHSGAETSYSAPTAETLMSPEMFARTQLDNRAYQPEFGPGETALSTEMLGNQTIVDFPIDRRAETLPPPDEFVTHISTRDAMTGVGFSKESPTVPIKDVVNRAADTIAVAAVDPLRTLETPVMPDTPTSPTDRVLAAGAPRAVVAQAVRVEEPAESAGSGRWIVIGAVVVLLAVAIVAVFVVLPRLRQPWSQPTTTQVSEPTAPPVADSPVNEPAPVAAPVEVLQFRIETMTGAPLPVASGAFPADADFRIRYTPSRNGRFYVIVVNPDRTQTVFLSDQPAPQAKVATNEVRAGMEYTFPGPEAYVVPDRNRASPARLRLTAQLCRRPSPAPR
ncbi:MAG: protein kinase [Blastocatellia bacterium]|nr:protein kinase [Blastocatellia bacterium]